MKDDLASSFESFPKQFIISNGPVRIGGGRSASLGGWTVTAAPNIPLCPILKDGEQLGLLIGWPVVDGDFVLEDKPLALRSEDGPLALRSWPGRYLFLFMTSEGPEVHLGPAGLLPAVFDKASGLVGSTPAILACERRLEPDRDIWAVFDFPKRKGFFPFGLTPWKEVGRLLPNHCLMLSDFKVRRLWPSQGASFQDQINNPSDSIAQLARRVQSTVQAILRKGSSPLYLSGGCDSRMVLAASRQMADRLRCETYLGKDRIDTFLSAKVAELAGVPHRHIAEVEPTEDDVHGWLNRAGWCVHEEVTYSVATVRANDPGYFPLTGTCAEILRGSNWTREDLGVADLPASTLLARLRVPAAKPIVDAADRWLAELPAMRRTAALDVAKIENIHGCWAAPSVYGHDIQWPSMHPFADGLVTDVALSLPETYKFSNQAFHDFVASTWPELLGVPINRVTGFDLLRFPKESLRRSMPVGLKRALKPFR